MNSHEAIQNSLDFIEDNLRTDISIEELCRLAGYSPSYYYRLFHRYVGIPVRQYILRRRLCHAIYDISRGERMIDVALRYGFDTHAGFFKAFRREYDCSPTQYLKRRQPSSPCRISLDKERPEMLDPKTISKMLAHWNMETEKIGAFYYESTGIKSDSSWRIGEDHLLKTGSNLTALKHHIAVTKALQASDILCTVPVPTLDNRDYIYDGQFYFCLTSLPRGNCIIAGNLYTDPHAEEITRGMGALLGRLQAVLKAHDADIFCDDVNLIDIVREWSLPICRERLPFPDAFYDTWLAAMERLGPALPIQPIHRNPTPSDYIVHNHRPVGFIEFEMMERNIRLFDPCYSATGILNESLNAPQLDRWFDFYRNILLGYDEVARLTAEEKEALPHIVLAVCMLCYAYFCSHGQFASLAETNRRLLLYVYDNQDRLKIF